MHLLLLAINQQLWPQEHLWFWRTKSL